MALPDLFVKVGADLAGFYAEMGEIGPKLNSISKSAEKEFSGFSRIGDLFAGTGAALTAAITVPLAGAGAAATHFYGEFESSMNRVSALGEITGSNLDKLKTQALELGAKTQFSAKQAADGMAELSAAGFDTTQIMQAMPAVLSLAASGQLSVGQSAEMAANLMGGFGIGADGVGRAVDVIAKAAASGSLSVSDLGSTFRYVGPVATAAGVSFETTAAAATILSNAGIKGEQAGTSLRGVLASLVSPAGAAATTLERLGVQTTDASGKMLPLEDVLNKLKSSGATTADVFTIFGRESASAAQVLITQGAPALQSMTTKLQDSEGAASRMASTINNGLTGAWERAKGSIETAGISLGQVLAPAIIRVAGIIEQGANKFSEFVQWFRTLPEPVQAAIGTFVGLAAAIGPVLLTAGSLISAFGTVSAGVTALAGVVGLAAAPFVGWVVAIAAAAAALVGLGVWINNHWDQIVAVVAEAWKGVQEIWEGIWDRIGREIKGWFNAIGLNAERIWTGIVGFVKGIWDGYLAFQRTLWGGVYTVLRATWERIWDTAKVVWSAIASQIETFIGWARQIPGVNRLFNLDEAWNAARRLETGVKATTDAVKAQGDGARKAGDDNKSGFVPGLDAGTDGVRRQREEIEQIIPKNELWYAVQQKLEAEEKKRIDNLAALIVSTRDFGRVTEDIAKGAESLADKMSDITREAGLTKEKFNTLGQAMPEALGKGKEASGALEDAFRRLGITSSAVMKEKAEAAKAAYDQIKQSGTATSKELEQAWVKMEEANIAAAEAAGRTITQEQRDTLAKAKGDLQGHVQQTSAIWREWSTTVTDISSRLGRSLSDILFDDDLSFGQKARKAIGAIGDTFRDVFEEKAKKYIGDFISDTISDLLSGRGLGGVINSIKEIGSGIASVFGGGGGGGNIISSAGGAATSAGGGAASTAGAVTGSAVSGIVGAVGSVVGAISSVIGNFQMAGINKSLDLIENYTRYTKIWTGEQSQSILWSTQTTAERLNYVNASLDDIKNYFLQYVAPMKAVIEMNWQWALGQLQEINYSTAYMLQQEQANGDALRDIAFAMASMGQGGNITVNVTGPVGDVFQAQQIGQEIARSASLRGGRGYF